MNHWVRLHTAPRAVRRWMVDVGMLLSHYKLRVDAPPRIKWLYRRSRDRWAATPEGMKFISALDNTLRSGVLTTYSNVLWVES